jgi:hypothetical protein
MSLRSLWEDYRNISRAMSAVEREHHIASSAPQPVAPAAGRSWLMGELTDPDHDDTASISEWGPMSIDHDQQRRDAA